MIHAPSGERTCQIGSPPPGQVTSSAVPNGHKDLGGSVNPPQPREHHPSQDPRGFLPSLYATTTPNRPPPPPPRLDCRTRNPGGLFHPMAPGASSPLSPPGPPANPCRHPAPRPSNTKPLGLFHPQAAQALAPAPTHRQPAPRARLHRDTRMSLPQPPVVSRIPASPPARTTSRAPAHRDWHRGTSPPGRPPR